TVRDKYIKICESGRLDRTWFEHCALLGPALCHEYEHVLRSVSEDDADLLHPCVEEWDCTESLATYHLQLLAILSLRYYIVRDITRDIDAGDLPGLHREGVRDHETVFGRPDAA